ncbi:hypothetical protein EMIHUDRAFT_246673 [Emiliania huxleyi CCMP1516]|uniref:Uncharacterized protein n=2 Tax=Emiliania huxleyi TaxID=2903 RepID=A0A0D3IR21_EMIH1|nr:hypothetical protein EMIHUDRAFT_246673 [Emiliania huxleyi CCMP1516]EOD13706.1 hypothetical protein EMIHUDRAFT_246673 [Emiliania huxleyi CCMP1516]|eukprot:XP_005766135.1 hypothetical protein EMIHUDRAFT_246673 [Emiliania huxleyi CCMP1516]
MLHSARDENAGTGEVARCAASGEAAAAREAAPTGSSSLACWPKRIDATFGKIERDGRRAGSVFVDASASSPMSPQLKSPGSVPTFNSPSESPAARKKWKPSPTLWQRLAAQAESIMHQDPRDKSYLVRVPTYPFVTEGEREKDEAEVVAEEEALVSSPSALSASPRTTFRPSLRNHEQFEAVLSAQFRAVTERRGKRRERKEFEKVRKKDRLTEQPEHRSNDIKVAALAAKLPQQRWPP